jgi:hypothetical protein
MIVQVQGYYDRDHYTLKAVQAELALIHCSLYFARTRASSGKPSGRSMRSLVTDPTVDRLLNQLETQPRQRSCEYKGK